MKPNLCLVRADKINIDEVYRLAEEDMKKRKFKFIAQMVLLVFFICMIVLSFICPFLFTW